MNTLADQADRTRFTTELDTNFNVIAPAGVGKTRAITERILSLCRRASQDPASLTRLSNLVVVTYTRKAAQEMQMRVEQALEHEDSVTQAARQALSNAYFGTIHRFCLKLLKAHGFFIGLPIELAHSSEDLWFDFEQTTRSLNFGLTPKECAYLYRSIDRKSLIRLAKQLPLIYSKYKCVIQTPPAASPMHSEPLAWDDFMAPSLRSHLDAVLAYEGGNAPVIQLQKALSHWRNQTQAFYAPLPEYKAKSLRFREVWEPFCNGISDQLGQLAFRWIQAVQGAYLHYRANRGLLYYDDMVFWARALIDAPEVQDRLHTQGYSIILDEAQDTDMTQFELLTRLAAHSPHGAELRAGAFCMVGDPQQSIFSSRASVQDYLSLCEALEGSGNMQRLVFSVTFRCSRAITEAVNGFLPTILTGTQGQVAFVPLTPRPDAPEGKVQRYAPALPENSDQALDARGGTQAESLALVQWLASLNSHDFNVRDWSEVAFLCPRNEWLRTLSSALEKQGILHQLHASDAEDAPLKTWLLAVLDFFCDSLNAVHMTGILRMIFGFSDADIASYTHACFESFSNKTECFMHPLVNANVDSDHPIAQAIIGLDALRETCLSTHCIAALHHIMEALQLLERLNSLDYFDPAMLEEEYKAICGLTQEAFREGHQDLWAWKKRLASSDLSAANELRVLDHHVQLLSCHKAKGLEWDVVILPFLHRPILEPHGLYPRIQRLPAKDSELRIQMNAWHTCDGIPQKIKKSRTQETQRLLYVALTRARQALILVEDGPFFKSSADSFADYLGFVSPSS